MLLYAVAVPKGLTSASCVVCGGCEALLNGTSVAFCI